VLERYEWARIGKLANAVVAKTVQSAGPATSHAAAFVSSSTGAYESRQNGDTVQHRRVPQSSPARRQR
jgi:hypothetical protein